jgi:acyl-CoA thioesterase-1
MPVQRGELGRALYLALLGDEALVRVLTWPEDYTADMHALVVAVVAALFLASPAAERVIVAFGDSLTAGLGVTPEDSYPARLQAKLRAEGYPYRVVNAGASGDTTAGGLRRVDWALRNKPDIVIVALGANDALRAQDLTSVRENLDAIVARFQKAGARVLLAGMEVPPNYGPRYASDFRRLYAEVARKRGVAFMPFLLDGVAGNPSLNQPDGIHPTAAGYGIVVDHLWPHLQPLLRR